MLRMPLPFRLDHINLYILDDPAGWTLVDSGLHTDDTMRLWEHLFATFLRDKPVLQIIVTHLHPDHIGLGEWLRVRTGAPLYMTAGEWHMARETFDLPVVDPERLWHHYEQLGVTANGLGAMVRQASSFRRLIQTLPTAVENLHDKDVLTLGGRRWQVRVGRGHSPECACLWDEVDGVLIAGDHVLPSISPNINLLASGPRDPLADYLASLRTFAELPCRLLLPAHGMPGVNYGVRIQELQTHHERHLDRLERFCEMPRSAMDCVPQLFSPGLPDHQMYFAIGESAAHLTYLAGQGRLCRKGDRPWTFVAT